MRKLDGTGENRKERIREKGGGEKEKGKRKGSSLPPPRSCRERDPFSWGRRLAEKNLPCYIKL